MQGPGLLDTPYHNTFRNQEALSLACARHHANQAAVRGSNDLTEKTRWMLERFTRGQDGQLWCADGLLTSLDIRNPLKRVYRKSVHIQSPVQMRASRKASGAHKANGVASLHNRSFLHGKFREVDVDAGKSMTMIETNRPPMQTVHLRDLDDAPGSGSYGRALGRAVVDAAMIVPGGLPIVKALNPERRIDALGCG